MPGIRVKTILEQFEGGANSRGSNNRDRCELAKNDLRGSDYFSNYSRNRIQANDESMARDADTANNETVTVAGAGGNTRAMRIGRRIRGRIGRSDTGKGSLTSWEAGKGQKWRFVKGSASASRAHMRG